MMVPIADLGRRVRRVLPELHAALDRVAASGDLLLGAELESFEAEWAAYVGQRHAVGVASGTDALRLVLQAMGVGEQPGDEVIVPAFTAPPTVAAVVAAGAVPVPVDVDPLTGAIDAAAARAALTGRTSAVVAVHLYGRPCPLPELGVPVVEDAAQAHGALRGPRPSVAAVYSFYPTKNLGGVGDGGAVVTDDPGLAESVRSLRNFGRGPDGGWSGSAAGARMSEIESAALRAFLPLLDADSVRRRAIAGHYRRAAPDLAWVPDHPDHVHHLCVLRERELLSGRLPFETALHYSQAIPEIPGYMSYARSACPNAERWARSAVTVPCSAELTDDEVEIVACALAEVAASR